MARPRVTICNVESTPFGKVLVIRIPAWRLFSRLKKSSAKDDDIRLVDPDAFIELVAGEVRKSHFPRTIPNTSPTNEMIDLAIESLLTQMQVHYKSVKCFKWGDEP